MTTTTETRPVWKTATHGEPTDAQRARYQVVEPFRPTDEELDLWARLVTVELPHPVTGRPTFFGVDPQTIEQTGPNESTATAYRVTVQPPFLIGSTPYAVVLDDDQLQEVQGPAGA